jgi:hypothetical protein
MKFTGRREGGEKRKKETLPSSHPPGEFFLKA